MLLSMSAVVDVLKWVVSGSDAVVMRCCVVVDGGHVDSVRVTLGVWLWVAVDVVLVPVLVLRMSLVVPKVLVSRAVALISSDGRVVSDGVDDVFSVASTLIRMHMQNEYSPSQTSNMRWLTSSLGYGGRE